MTLESATDPNEMNELIDQNQFPVRGWRGVWYGLFVIVLPTFSFWIVPAIKPEWQSGDLQDYVALLLDPKASLFFLFLIAYSVVCYILLLINAGLFSSSFLVRFGIYTGVLLALHFSMVLLLYLLNSTFSYGILLVWFLPLYFPRFYRFALEKWVRRYVSKWALLIIFIAYGIFTFFYNDALLPIFLAFLAIVASAPFWCFLIAAQAAIWLLQNRETGISLLSGFGVTAWVVGYIAAWRYDILKTYEMYSALPLVPPDCYIATVAAQGHSGFVGSYTVQLASGKSMQVNRQLQIFKCAELALLVVAPRGHKIFRSKYDLVGKPLARRIQHPLLADLAYLLLKPFEWVAKFVLRLIIGNARFDSVSIYSK
jgi:hypothetical protein